MIDPAAVDSWRSRKLRDSARVKRASRAKLEQAIGRLEPPPRFELDPRTHQLAAFLLAVRQSGFYLALDMGGGKTKVSLDVMRWRRDRGEVLRTLVLVPSTSNVDAWRREIPLHVPEASCAFLDSDVANEERTELFFGDSDIVVATYRGFLLQVTRNRAGELEPVERLIAKARAAFQFLICDESIALANHESLISRLVRRVAAGIAFRICMSGTPFGADPMGLWAQFMVTDRGDTLHKSRGMFREAFFYKKQGRYAVEWALRSKYEERLHRVLRHGSIRYTAAECLDLPKSVGGIESPMLRAARMSTTQARHILGLEQDMEDARADEDVEEVKNVYYRMRALAAGYLPTDAGPHFFKESPKCDALLQLIAEAPTEKWIVFIAYQASADLVTRALRRAKYKTTEVSGRVSNKGKALTEFQNDAQILIGSKSAMVGLNLQFCNRIVYFESPDAIDIRKQSERRILRMGQTRPCFIYDLVMAGTYDSRILKALRERKRVLDVVVDGRCDVFPA